ncbi:GlxA family transcriptional regulator [Pseudomonas sp. NPDC088368]|uniref:GlxA family transcriptional regulator n=1 Tax=Pseudomonas sp. NPDC088368 TaxID=3364453 RepID=UPI0037F360C7
MKITILAIEGVFDTGLTVLLDAFATANDLGILLLETSPHFKVDTIGVRSSVRTARGLEVPVSPVDPSSRPDWVIIPALNTRMPEELVESLGRADMLDAKEQLLTWHDQGAGIAASCIGTFLLAETGLLSGHEATTSWWLGPFFRQRYPDIALDESRMLVPADRLATAGAAMGHLDLALWIIRKFSPELAGLVARYMLADYRSLQAPYIIPEHMAHADPLVEKFERWARSQLSIGFSLQEAAKALATAPRTLQRRTEAVLGKSPLAFFQDMRVERAQHLVRTTNMDIEAIAAEVGYVDGATLRTLLRKRLGRGVREMRADTR